jgi:hypothetical protein
VQRVLFFFFWGENGPKSQHYEGKKILNCHIQRKVSLIRSQLIGGILNISTSPMTSGKVLLCMIANPPTSQICKKHTDSELLIGNFLNDNISFAIIIC